MPSSASSLWLSIRLVVGLKRRSKVGGGRRGGGGGGGGAVGDTDRDRSEFDA